MNKMSLSEMITYSTVLIHCKYSNGESGSGTGFIIDLCPNKENNTCVPAIITNDHVVANSIETVFEFCCADENGKPIDDKSCKIILRGDNTWLHHPDSSVDLRCLGLADLLRELKRITLKFFYIPLETNLIPKHKNLDELSAMEDVVMIGYPIGLSDTYNHKPIIRRGITASHPKKITKEKETLLDMACYPGSSGSPVFILNQGAYITREGITMGSRVYLLGVLYGGHEFNAQGVLQFAICLIPCSCNSYTDQPRNNN